MTLEEMEIKNKLGNEFKSMNINIGNIIGVCNLISQNLTNLISNPFYETEASVEEKARISNISSIHSQFMSALAQLEQQV